MTGGVRLMISGILLLIFGVAFLWDWEQDDYRWRRPIAAGVVVFVAGGLIGYALGVGPG